MDGVPQFVEDDCYSADLPEADIQELNGLTLTRDWKTALRDCARQSVREAASEIQNLDRANWRWFLDLKPDTLVLDIGSGLGATCHALALCTRAVVAAEPNLEQVKFLRVRVEQDRLKNVQVVRASVWRLPLAANTFDLVTMDGSLPRVTEGRRESPETLQQKAVELAFQLLRPGGSLYLGVPNRLGVGLLGGEPDPYSRLPFAAVLPRVVANWYARANGRDGYRHFLYSCHGYRELLTRSGFSQIEIYAAAPGYRQPKFLIPMEAQVFGYYLRNFNAGHTCGIRRLAQRALHTLGILHHFASSFVILARK